MVRRVYMLILELKAFTLIDSHYCNHRHFWASCDLKFTPGDLEQKFVYPGNADSNLLLATLEHLLSKTDVWFPWAFLVAGVYFNNPPSSNFFFSGDLATNSWHVRSLNNWDQIFCFLTWSPICDLKKQNPKVNLQFQNNDECAFCLP